MNKAKAYLNNPNRISIVTNHRKFSQIAMSKFSTGFITKMTFCGSTILGSQLPTQDCDLASIQLKDMGESEDHVYDGRLLELTIIDDPMFGFSSVNFAVEDENHDVTRLSVYGIPHDEATRELLGFGTVIKIVNPFLRYAVDGKSGIRVDDPKTIFVAGKKKDMCRYCGEENAKMKCSNCKRLYCGKHCQKRDWQIMKHKKVCKM